MTRPAGPRHPKPIRQRLLAVVLLGLITSAVTLVALVRILSLTAAQRVERGREAVTEELDRIAVNPAAEITRTTIVGLRAGVAESARAEDVPAGWRAPIDGLIADARDGREVREAAMGSSTLVMAARPTGDGRVVWAAYLVAPPQFLRFWQIIIVGITIATALLVATAVHAIVVVQRDAQALDGTLAALASDLSTPVPRTEVRELADVADGIQRLAASLARSRRDRERLSQRLAERDRLAALGRVVAGVAHEVRNPLASIKLRLDLARAKGALPPDADRAVSHASTEIDRLDRLVADLLLVAGRSAGERKDLDLAALVRARADALAPWAHTREVTFVVRGTARAHASADSISRAIDNLLRNAVDASPRGGEVGIEIKESEDRAIVSVEDRGEGVAEARVGELFEPFFTTKGDGTGLGLAISRSIARAHGGDVVYSRDADTTRFLLSMDARASARGEELASDAEAAA